VNIKIVAEGKMLPTLKESFQIFTTFSLTMLAWIFFRSESVSQAIEILGKIFSSTVLSAPKSVSIVVLILVFLFFVIEWLGRANRFAIEYLLPSSSRFLRWSFYYIIIILIFLFGGQHQQFIYFQF
jgi:hypothetical protein